MQSYSEVLGQVLDKRFGNQPFITLGQLIEINFFGSAAAARQALKHLPHIKVSAKRSVIPREEFLAFVEKNCRGDFGKD